MTAAKLCLPASTTSSSPRPRFQTRRLASEKVSRYMFVKSRLNLTLKQTRSEALLWATDLASGQPVPDLSVGLYTGPDQMEAVARTGAEGLAVVDDLPLDDLWNPFFAVAGEPGDEGFGIAYNRWEEGINPWDFGVDSEFWGSEYQGYLYTDRPIYRPGQTVYFKGIVRADDDAGTACLTELEDCAGAGQRSPGQRAVPHESCPSATWGPSTTSWCSTNKRRWATIMSRSRSRISNSTPVPAFTWPSTRRPSSRCR